MRACKGFLVGDNMRFSIYACRQGIIIIITCIQKNAELRPVSFAII